MVVAEDVLPKVLHRWGPIPGVLGTRDLTGTWSTPGGSSFRWTYTFHPRGRVAGVVLALLARTAWARYMHQCADLCVSLAEEPPG